MLFQLAKTYSRVFCFIQLGHKAQRLFFLCFQFAFCLGEIDFNTVCGWDSPPSNFTTQSIPRRIQLFVAFVPLKAFRKWEIDFPLCHYVESRSLSLALHPPSLALISFVTLNFFYVSKFGTIEEIKSQKGRVKQWRIKFAGPGVTMAQDMNN